MYIYKTSFKIWIFFLFFSAKVYFSQGNKSSLKIVTVIHPSSIMKAFLKEFSCTYKTKNKTKTKQVFSYLFQYMLLLLRMQWKRFV